MNIRRLLPLALVSAALFVSTVATAQEALHIKGNVVIFNKMDGKKLENGERVYYGFFKTKEDAEKAMARIERTREGTKGDNISAATLAEENLNALRKQLGITSTTTRGKRTFEEEMFPGMALLFMTNTDFETAMIVIKEGQTEYKDVTINVKRVKEVVSIGTAREADVIGGGITGDPDDGNEYFPVRFKLAAGNGRTDSRLIIQTYAVDCQTEDTLDYCSPLVYEGEKYHSLQNRRMAFDYMKHDKIAMGYSDSIVLDVNEPIEVNTVVVYKKPDHLKKRTFKGPFKFVLEDYHHVYREGGWEGTCLRERPFKFLDFSPALAQLELTEEFHEEAKSKVDNKNRDLDLRFEVGTDVLTKDSMNDVQMKLLVEELRSYGSQLMSPTIIGAASPDGSRATNERLARQRAQMAVNMMGRYLGGTKAQTSVKMYTWADVVARLRKGGHAEEADAIDAVLASGTRDDIALTRAMKAMPTYTTVIEPVLASMRVMKCAYKVLRQYVMTPAECVAEFHNHKKDYQEGRRHFSNGDYYNLFDNIRDSVELDELTIMAYHDILQTEDYATESRIAPYVANRMALMNLRRGLPQSAVLDPFIDYSRRGINASKYIDDMLTIKVNRREIVTNQAVTYYQEQKLDSAMYLINLIKSAGVKDKNIEMLEYYMDLKRFHYLKRRSAEQEQRYQQAKQVVLSSSDDNKAILYTEIKDWGMRDQADQWVSQMDDGDPKKWYLKALLAVDKAGTPDEAPEGSAGGGDASGGLDIGGGFTLLSEDQKMDLMEKQPDRYTAYMKQLAKYAEEHDGQVPEYQETVAKEEAPAVDTEGIPNYLAYFQHSFDLEPGYKRLYFSEGHVVEDMRRKFKYKKKNIPAYRALFQALKRQDDLKRVPKATGSDDEDDMGGLEG